MRIYFLFILFLVSGSIWAQETDSVYIQPVPETVTSDSLMLQFLSQSGVPKSSDNRVELLMSGRDKFQDLFASIREAEHHIHMEYFNFRNDSIANALFDLLAVKAAQGVEVRLLFDAFGNWSNNKPLKKRHLKEIRSSGIEIVKFDPINFPYINHVFHRDHRKIVVLDGRVGYTGGMNIADYYIHGLPEIGDWRDMHMRIEGTAVHYLQDIFFSVWNKETKQDIGGPVYYPVVFYADTLHTQTVAVVDRIPRVSPKLLRRALAKSIQSAQKSVHIINPYFLPTKLIHKEIKKAIDRGVDVDIMISSKSDISFTPDASLYVAHKLMKRGADIYLYDKGFHHSKIMMIDSVFCTVGSANLNSRSLRYDYETNAFIFDEDTTGELLDMFADDVEDSTLLTEEKWKQRSKWKRFVGWFAHLFTPFL